MSALVDIYLTQIRLALVGQFQYRVATLLWMLSMVVEPVVYLVVWTTIARSQGGTVQGFTVGDFAAYYIAWTVVRHMNISLTPYAWEQRIRRGELNGELLRPIHPFHIDLGFFMGWKGIYFVAWLPVAALLTLAFRPTLNPEPWQALGFLIAIFTGFVMRFALTWVLGLITFWVTRVSAIFELYFALELLLSGRLVPIELLPPWAQRLTAYLPFQWAFGFPIEVLLGRRTPDETLMGFAAQGFWFLVGIILLRLLWPAVVRRYSAVGG